MTGFIFGTGLEGNTSITATGTTTARSLQDRFAEKFNVKDFGAQGNSNIGATIGTDDRAAIQAAVNAAQLQGGGVIFFPAGFYKVGGSVTFDSSSGVQYIFEGVGSGGAHAGGGGGSVIVGNFDGFLLDRNVINDAGARVVIEKLGFRNAWGGCLRVLGIETGQITGCSMQSPTYGIKMGSFQPVGASFTGNSSGSTSLVVTSIVGVIEASTFECPINGTGEASPVRIVSQFSGTTGGNGTYITNIPTTCTNAALTSHPNGPTVMSSVIENCTINGTGTYNANPDLSFTGVGVQLGTNSFIRECHLNNWGVGIRHYGGQGGITSCQLESNTTAIRLGENGEGDAHQSTALSVVNCSLESNYIGLHINLGVAISIQSTMIQCTVTADHNSKYGILIDGVQFCKIESTFISGEFISGGYGLYLNGTEQIFGVLAESCNLFSVEKSGSVNYGCMELIRCANQGFVWRSTLAQLNTAISNGEVNPGDTRFISDATKIVYDGSGSAPVQATHQCFGAPVTGGGGNIARVWYDGSTVRYG